MLASNLVWRRYWIGIYIKVFDFRHSVYFAHMTWISRVWHQGKQFRRPDVYIKDKVVIVTGCNTGIGKETVLEMAKRGGRVYMACRDKARCEEARQEIIRKSKNPNVFNRHLDLSSLESVRNFVKE